MNIIEEPKYRVPVDALTTWVQQNKQLTKLKDYAIPVGATFIVYLGVVRYYRYKNLKHIMKRYPNPQAILYDAEAAQEVFSITVKREFPCKKNKIIRDLVPHCKLSVN